MRFSQLFPYRLGYDWGNLVGDRILEMSLAGILSRSMRGFGVLACLIGAGFSTSRLRNS
jgi:hypothetical protein